MFNRAGYSSKRQYSEKKERINFFYLVQHQRLGKDNPKFAGKVIAATRKSKNGEIESIEPGKSACVETFKNLPYPKQLHIDGKWGQGGEEKWGKNASMANQNQNQDSSST